MSGTRAKFFVSAITRSASPGATVKLTAATRGYRNKEWASATPMGTIELTINNEAAVEFYETLLARAKAGGTVPEVWVDMTPCTDGFAGDGHLYEPTEAAEGEYGHGHCAACGYALDSQVVTYEPGKSPAVVKDTLPAHPNG